MTEHTQVRSCRMTAVPLFEQARKLRAREHEQAPRTKAWKQILRLPAMLNVFDEDVRQKANHLNHRRAQVSQSGKSASPMGTTCTVCAEKVNRAPRSRRQKLQRRSDPCATDMVARPRIAWRRGVQADDSLEFIRADVSRL